MKCLGWMVVGIMVVVNAVSAQSMTGMGEEARIMVNGEASVNVRPDKAVISLGIETSDMDIRTAERLNRESLQKTMQLIREFGIPDKDIQTAHLSIEPRYKDGYLKNNFAGYFVRNTMTVTVMNTEKLEEMVTRLLMAGVNYIHNVDFQVTEAGKYQDQAREMALKAAREKAVAMSAVLGQSVGRPLQIIENSGFTPLYSGAWNSSFRGMAMMQNVSQNIMPAGGEGGSESIPSGMISIRASVSVAFELKP
ncbi:MAG: SIMPL domain-containing protein [Candidatus Delongbacteria bacterium]|nr:SIMPL domain-containing protein [Candidatus Delongbacteria bacterium]